MHLSDLKLTLLFDNVAYDPRLNCLWGFACLYEGPGVRVLFDTGSNGRLLLHNMRTLGIDPSGIDFLFLSHTHWDHMGGLDTVLELNPGLHLLVPAGTSPRMIDNLHMLCRKVSIVGKDPLAFAPALASSGTFPSEPPEQALVITASEGAVVITGCAHPGVVTIADAVTRQTGTTVALLAGGYHLFQESAETVTQTAEDLAALGVRHIMPTHCTGASAMQQLQELFGQRFIPGGQGHVVAFDKDGRPGKAGAE
ncbi:MAG: MBL fold metallo-hydrolase [Candidatus Thiodiazotropha sp.]|nr:MBL fold metallo-hydrolase [Candidatus Thiodiazotropha taylori]MBT3060992.1 MBL fold metallo-hydrolase [Candidatus Thiodiazotropha sp. (ex Lucina pensylvanica)]MBV2097023.1 MBL fold metallo-hydrolase [Candidatus Thiodiazotropha sp. (ex Codakia orbicularis)]PUB73323.1 MAG: MBL fold metallo-hydrolase [gamma proteobacterium symbiont of Ctena orbiculata]MBT3064130.1 MBL fold metallo-hydrolase [Candidatus Thiodiazotropha sp. (ex Lucina pensylvanica)]